VRSAVPPDSGSQPASGAEPAATAPTAPLEPAPLLHPVLKKGTPVKTPAAPKPSEVDVCAQKLPPAKDTPAFRAWCQCAAIVGTLVAVQAGCAAPQVRRPVPEEKCPDEAKEAMRELGLDENQFLVQLEKDHPGVEDETRELWLPEGPITGKSLSPRFPEMPYGTLLHGHLWFTEAEDGWEGRGWYVRYTRAELPNGKTYPVCIQLPATGEWPWGRKSKPGLAEVVRVTGAEAMWDGWNEPDPPRKK
jgi:hypothetical protein